MFGWMPKPYFIGKSRSRKNGYVWMWLQAIDHTTNISHNHLNNCFRLFFPEKYVAWIFASTNHKFRSRTIEIDTFDCAIISGREKKNIFKKSLSYRQDYAIIRMLPVTAIFMQKFSGFIAFTVEQINIFVGI